MPSPPFVGSAALIAPTCRGWGKLIGCSGSRPCDDEAPLYAETTVAAAARARKPGMTVHFLFFVIAARCEVSERDRTSRSLCERFHKTPKLARNLTGLRNARKGRT